MANEIAIMKSSQHECIVTYYDSYLVEGKLWVVMEFMGGGCLTDVLEAFESGVRMTETQMVHFSFFNFFFLKTFSSILILALSSNKFKQAYCARETLRALAYIHQNHRIHRDIKVILLHFFIFLHFSSFFFFLLNTFRCSFFFSFYLLVLVRHFFFLFNTFRCSFFFSLLACSLLFDRATTCWSARAALSSWRTLATLRSSRRKSPSATLLSARRTGWRPS